MRAVETGQATLVRRGLPGGVSSAASARGSSSGGWARPSAHEVRTVLPPPPPTSRRTLRLTRRGQLAGVLIVAAAVYGAFGLGRASALSPASTRPPQAVVVQPGDSLWSIAQQALPHQDPRESIAQLKALNHLTTVALSAGDRILVP